MLAVDSSIGDKMWPVSTVEGIISSVTSRLPGQQITFRFERPYENMESSLLEEPMAATTAIVEVEELVQLGDIRPEDVHLPGVFVQRIFQGSDYENTIEIPIYAEN